MKQMAQGLAAKFYNIFPESIRLERIWLLSKTDFKIRYSASTLGLLWAFMYPLVRILIYYIVFSFVFAKDIPNYGFYIFSGIIIWLYFQESSKSGLRVIRMKRYLLENINFNRLDVFYASILTSLISFIVNISVLIFLMIIMGITPTWKYIYYPIFIFNLIILSLGVGLILSTISVYYKDIKQFWDLILLLMFWINPIFFAKQKIFNMFPSLLYANPLAGIIINSRDVLMYGKEPDWFLAAYGYFYAIVILLIGLWSFKKFFHKAIEKV